MNSGTSDKMAIGVSGENTAAAYLKKIGCRMLMKNVRIGSDEIDIVARDRGGTLLLVEVKSLRAGKEGSQNDSIMGLIPEDNFTRQKARF